MILHVGLTLSEEQQRDPKIVHCPFIEIIATPREDLNPIDFTKMTHLLFTSKTAVDLWVEYFGSEGIEDKVILSVGKGTTRWLKENKIKASFTAQEESAEGVIKLLEDLDLEGARLLWPHAAGSRSLIVDYCHARGIKIAAPVFYTTLAKRPEILPDLSLFDKVYFSSSSSVEAFFEVFPHPPVNLQFETIGPVTEKTLLASLGTNQRR